MSHTCKNCGFESGRAVPESGLWVVVCTRCGDIFSSENGIYRETTEGDLAALPPGDLVAIREVLRETGIAVH